ncbi:hypothetical protein LCGC14_3012680, partial [marine sediment metagenome]
WSMNAVQIANARRMREDVKAICPNLRAPLLGAGFREHSELTNGATECPSGAIAPFYQSYLQTQEEDMDQDEFNKLFKHAVDHEGLDSVDNLSLGRSVNVTRDQIIAAIDALDLGEVNYEKLAKALLKEMA